jgi:putative RecB family exonuclease
MKNPHLTPTKPKEVLKYSYSQLNTFKTCPQQYKIIYMDGVRKPHESIEAFMGKRVHEVLEWVYDKDNRSKSYQTFDSLCKTYDEYWVKNWHENIYIADYRNPSDFYYSIGKRCLSNYYNKYGPSFDEPVAETEIELQFKIDNHPFRGIIDRLDNPGKGKWVIHDYKTSKREKNQRQAFNDLQLGLYYLAVQQNYKEIEEISLCWHFLRTGNEVLITHTQEKMELIRRKLTKLIKKINFAKKDENNFIPKESILCNWCYLWEECTAKLGKNLVVRAE